MKTTLVLLSAIAKDAPNWPAIVLFAVIMLFVCDRYRTWSRRFFQLPPEKPQ